MVPRNKITVLIYLDGSGELIKSIHISDGSRELIKSIHFSDGSREFIIKKVKFTKVVPDCSISRNLSSILH